MNSKEVLELAIVEQRAKHEALRHDIDVQRAADKARRPGESNAAYHSRRFAREREWEATMTASSQKTAKLVNELREIEVREHAARRLREANQSVYSDGAAMILRRLEGTPFSDLDSVEKCDQIESQLWTAYGMAPEGYAQSEHIYRLIGQVQHCRNRHWGKVPAGPDDAPFDVD